MSPHTKQWRTLRHTIGQNIHQQRRRRNMSLAKLARKTNLPENTIDDYELGKHNMRIDYLLRIANTLNTNIIQLMQR